MNNLFDKYWKKYIIWRVKKFYEIKNNETLNYCVSRS